LPPFELEFRFIETLRLTTVFENDLVTWRPEMEFSPAQTASSQTLPQGASGGENPPYLEWREVT
jgi:hypothetical protein